MARYLLYKGPVIIELQGEEALSFSGDTKLCAHYTIIGFNQKRVTIKDFRQEPFKGLDQYWKTGNPDLFHQLFCSEAFLEIYQEDSNDLSLELHPAPTFEVIDTILWIVVCMGKELPVYDYVFLESDTDDNEHFSILALYQTEPQRKILSDLHLVTDNHA